MVVSRTAPGSGMGSRNSASRVRAVSAPARRTLLTDSEPLDELVVALRVLALQVIEQTAAAADELHETAAGVMILGVRLEVIGQISNPVRQQRDLDLGRSRVGVVSSKLPDDFRLL